MTEAADVTCKGFSPSRGNKGEATWKEVFHLEEVQKSEEEFALLGANLKGLDANGVAIPYFDENGVKIGQKVKFRKARPQWLPSWLPVEEVSWETGSLICPYGLWLLDKAKKQGYVLLVMGESNCWTAWAYDIPSLGLPMREIWRKEWGQYLDKLKVFIWQEAGMENLTLQVRETIPDLMVIESPPGFKDITHLQGVAVEKGKTKKDFLDVFSILKDFKAYPAFSIKRFSSKLKWPFE